MEQHFNAIWQQNAIKTQSIAKYLKYNGLSITNETFLENMDLQWDLDSLCDNQNISTQSIITYCEMHKILTSDSWGKITNRYNDSHFDFIVANPQYPWKYKNLEYHEGLTSEIILAHPEWNMPPHTIIYCHDVPMDVKIEFLRKQGKLTQIEWYHFSHNSSIEFIIANPQYPWNFKAISQNKTLNVDIVLAHLNIPWDFEWMDKFNQPNPYRGINYVYANVTIKHLVENPNVPWNWKYLSLYYHDNFTIDEKFANKDLPWIWSDVCEIDAIKFRHVIENPEMPWDFEYLFKRYDFMNDMKHTYGHSTESCEFEIEKLTHDKNLYIENNITRVLVVSMMAQLQVKKPTKKKFTTVFADEYITNRVIQY